MTANRFHSLIYTETVHLKKKKYCVLKLYVILIAQPMTIFLFFILSTMSMTSSEQLPYEGLNLVNQESRKLGVFDRKLLFLNIRQNETVMFK